MPGEPTGATAHRRIAVVTDDAAALAPRWLEQAQRAGAATGSGSDGDSGASGRSGLVVVGMPVMVDEQIFAPSRPSEEPDLARALLVALAEGRKVSTSRPSPGQFRRVYQQLEAQGFSGIVSVHLSGELSGTVSSARIARQEIGIPVTVVDTRTVAMAQGFGVMAAWEAAGAGASLEEVAQVAREAAHHDVVLYVPTLEQLKRGGRLAPSVARLGSMLQIKPLLTVRDGKLVAAELPRTAVKAKARFHAMVGNCLAQSLGSEDALQGSVTGVPDLVVHHLADPDAAHVLAAEVIEQYAPQAVAEVVEIPPVLAAHVGIGVRAAVVRRTSPESRHHTMD